MKNKKLRSVLLLVVLILTVVACSATTSTANCAFIVGDGTYDATVHDVLYPGQQKPDSLSNEIIRYVPCNSRNYIINDGTELLNGVQVGDRHTLIDATTKNGLHIKIAANALWTLNQNREEMELFYTHCLKYNCASTEDIGGDANYSTEGWNGMLAEDFSNAMEAAGKTSAYTLDVTISELQDPETYKLLGEGMSLVFADKVRPYTGFSNENLFCASGQSQWPDATAPGVGEFDCLPVRIVVRSIILADDQSAGNTDGAQTLNEQRVATAEQLYGEEDAKFWLALQDTIDHCKAANTVCFINLGTNGPEVPTIINVEQTPPTPEPAPTETP